MPDLDTSVSSTGQTTTVPNLIGEKIITSLPEIFQYGEPPYVTREELAELKDQFDEIYDILQKLVKITGTEREQLENRIQLFNVKSSHKL